MRRSSAVLVVSVCGALSASAPALAQEGRPGTRSPASTSSWPSRAATRPPSRAGRTPATGRSCRWSTASRRRSTPRRSGRCAASARVAYVEPDRVVTADATQNMDANGDPWGLDRIDQRTCRCRAPTRTPRTAAGVTAYVIDTGHRRRSHREFGGRAPNVYDALGGNGADCNGHGTHVAGTIGGSTYGVAKAVHAARRARARLHRLRLDVRDHPALDWVARQRIPSRRWPTCRSAAGARRRSTRRPTTSPTRACSSPWRPATRTRTPATSPRRRRPTAYTTAASDRSDREGLVLELRLVRRRLGAGRVDQVGLARHAARNTISGTSMATPHVAGVGGALQVGAGDASSAAVANWINANATPNMIARNPSGTPNRLLYKRGL